MGILQIENRAGEPVIYGQNKIFPIAQVVQLKLPFPNGGLIWNRPVAVAVQGPDSLEERLPVYDATRLAQVALLAFGLTMTLFFWLMGRNR